MDNEVEALEWMYSKGITIPTILEPLIDGYGYGYGYMKDFNPCDISDVVKWGKSRGIIFQLPNK